MFSNECYRVDTDDRPFSGHKIVLAFKFLIILIKLIHFHFRVIVKNSNKNPHYSLTIIIISRLKFITVGSIGLVNQMDFQKKLYFAL